MPQQGEGHRRAERDRALQALRAGNTRRAAAAYAGIAAKTLWEWARDDPAFRNEIEKAEADAEVRHVANIAKAAADGVWTASAWWLERKCYQEWGRKDTIALQLAKKTPEELVEFIAEDLLAAGIDIRNLGSDPGRLTEGEAPGSGTPEGAGLLTEGRAEPADALSE